MASESGSSGGRIGPAFALGFVSFIGVTMWFGLFAGCFAGALGALVGLLAGNAKL